MPSSKTHYFFTQQLYLQDKDTFSFLKDNLDIVLLAAQGPDPLMFYGHIPFRKRNSPLVVNRLATLLHQDKNLIMGKFAAFYHYALQQEAHKKNILLAAIYGELSHYALDKNFHPYVFYVTGYVPGVDEVSYFVDHARFETMMDTEFERLYQQKVTPDKIIHCDIEKVQLISKMYAECVEGFTSDYYEQGYRDMLTIEKTLKDRFGIKKFLLEIFGMKHHHAHALSHYPKKKKDDPIDYLNESKSSWLFPDTGIESHLSLIELMQNARQDFQLMSRVFQDGDLGQLGKQLSTLNYDGVAYGQKHLYGKSVYKK